MKIKTFKIAAKISNKDNFKFYTNSLLNSVLTNEDGGPNKFFYCLNIDTEISDRELIYKFSIKSDELVLTEEIINETVRVFNCHKNAGHLDFNNFIISDFFIID